jgi:hypothetical protein
MRCCACDDDVAADDGAAGAADADADAAAADEPDDDDDDDALAVALVVAEAFFDDGAFVFFDGDLEDDLAVGAGAAGRLTHYDVT